MIEQKEVSFEETLEWLKNTEYNGAIGVTAMFRPNEEYIEEFEALLKDYIPYVQKEEGCIQFSFNRDWQDSNNFWLTEQWASPKILLEHLGPNSRKGTKYEGSIPLDKMAGMGIIPKPAAIFKVGLE